MYVNDSESGLQYFIQKMAQYIIFENKLIRLPYKDHIAIAYLWYHRPKHYKFQKWNG